MNYINEWNLDLFNQHFKTSLNDNSSNKNLKVDSFSIAGEGNMNFTYRLLLDDKSSVILKQAPPFCAKFPSIPAPVNRILSEKTFYELVSKSELLSKHSPQILAFDPTENALYMNDLGSGSDYENVYALEKIENSDLKALCNYLNELHSLNIDDISFNNEDMKELNYNYIFKLPYDLEDKSIRLDNITEGLDSILLELKSEAEVISKIHILGDMYLSEKRCLIHGDFYPRSWLKTDSGLFVIDPEFAFIGLAEFDIGVFLAHMAMSQSFQSVFLYLEENYSNKDFSWDLALDFCAVEILRRIFYVSQLPILNDLSFKDSLYRSSIKRLKDSSYRLKELK